MGIFSGRHDTDDEDERDLPIDDAASFDLTRRQQGVKVRKQMEKVWAEILSHYTEYSRSLKYVYPRRRR